MTERRRKALAADEHTAMTVIKANGDEHHHVEDFVIRSNGRLYGVQHKNGSIVPELSGLFTDKDKALKAVISFIEKAAKNEKDHSNHGGAEL